MNAASRAETDEAGLSEEVRAEIDRWTSKYPDDKRESAVIAALSAVQLEQGWISTEMMDAVAKYLGMPAIGVYEVASFYSWFELKPVGRHVIAVCNNISCMLCGAEELIEHIGRKYDVKPGGTSPDGRFTLRQEEECLAACDGAPMMMIDGRYYENLTKESVESILDGLE